MGINDNGRDNGQDVTRCSGWKTMKKLKRMLAAFPGFAAEVVMGIARRDVNNREKNVGVRRERDWERDRGRMRAESKDKMSKRSRTD